MKTLIYFIMKNKLIKITIIIFFILILIKKDIMYITIYKTTLLWFKNIVPNLLPMFIITSFIVNSNLIINICNIFGKLFNKLFNTSIYGFFVYSLSLFTGCPSNAKYIKDLLDNNLISSLESDKLLLFTTNYNPLLILSLLSFFNKFISIKILITIIISNIIVGLIYRNRKNILIKSVYNNKNINIPNIIKNTIDTLIMILGTLIFFNIIVNLLPIKNKLIKNILNGFLEITTALNNLKYLNINLYLKEILSVIYLSFGGLSIHMQIKSILPNMNYKSYLKSRILAIAISIIIFLILTW